MCHVVLGKFHSVLMSENEKGKVHLSIITKIVLIFIDCKVKKGFRAPVVAPRLQFENCCFRE